MSDLFYHAKCDPLQCTDDAGHDFTGWREFDDGLGGEMVCAKCGVGAMEHSMALDMEFDVFSSIAREDQSDG